MTMNEHRYWLFAGGDYYPNGGMLDLRGRFVSKREAKLSIANELCGNGEDFTYLEWAQVVDIETQEIVSVWVAPTWKVFKTEMREPGRWDNTVHPVGWQPEPWKPEPKAVTPREPEPPMVEGPPLPPVVIGRKRREALEAGP